MNAVAHQLKQRRRCRATTTSPKFSAYYCSDYYSDYYSYYYAYCRCRATTSTSPKFSAYYCSDFLLIFCTHITHITTHIAGGALQTALPQVFAYYCSDYYYAYYYSYYYAYCRWRSTSSASPSFRGRSRPSATRVVI
jgi:hypothetical protein